MNVLFYNNSHENISPRFVLSSLKLYLRLSY